MSDNVLDVSGGAFAPVKSGQKGFGGEIYGSMLLAEMMGKHFILIKEFLKVFLVSWFGCLWIRRLKSCLKNKEKTFPFLIAKSK